ncbi:50S ribosomal protein L13 [Marinitoga aeolica]|uniref:Large ribosomal subunit protein uL13 n=2 Tax=Marinitoga aeolica TaxID=2809031 RepID=A0ABY8PTV8_9BACT|nr:50S ribosomal protein L13 [Marinitoga aeolica]
MTQKSYLAKNEEVERKWYVVDAAGMSLGRLAAQVAKVLQGKHKPTYTPHVDTGDYVIVINAEKIVLTGKKLTQKKYYRHTGYPGGIKEQTAKDILEKYPERLIEKAVKGMLPKTTLGRHMFKKLKVYSGSNHPHEAQKPEKLEL